MNSGELNKIAGGLIGALLVFLLLGFFSKQIFVGVAHEEEDRELAFAVEVEESEGGEEEAGPDFAALLAEADASSGEKAFNKCKACHQVEDGANGVGPHLYNVVGREIAAVGGYTYSDALTSKEGDWSLENLFNFLHNPGGWAPGTKMGFSGLKDDQDKVDLIVWLNEAGGSPIEFEVPEAASAEGEAEEGEEQAAAEGEEQAAEGEEASAEGEAAAEEDEAASEGEAAEGEEAAAEGEQAAAEGEEAAAEGDEGAADTEQAAEEDADQQVAAADGQEGGDEQSSGQEQAEGSSDEASGEETAQASEDEGSNDAAGAEEPGESAQANPDEVGEQPVETNPETEVEAGTAATEVGQPDEEAAEADTDQASAESASEEEAATETEEASSDEEASDEPEGDSPFAPLLANADAKSGEKIYRKCKSCHKLEDGKNTIGPHLYGVINREIASVDGYKYSDALQSKDGVWDVENLDAFLTDPKSWAKGTKMSFAGLDDPQDRIDVITYINEADGSPEELGAATNDEVRKASLD